jgi:hypothetical protein
MVCEMWIVDNDNFAFPNNSERCFSSVSYFKNLNGLNVKLFPGLPGTCSPVEVVKKVNSVSIWIFSTIGAWYDLRFPVSVLFSWVCMWRCFMFLFVFRRSMFVYRSRFLGIRDALALISLTQSLFSSSPSTFQCSPQRSTFLLVHSVGLLFLGH